jgi:transposase
MEFSQGKLQIDVGGYADLLAQRKREYEKEHPQKIEHEFQEVGVNMVKWFQPKRPSIVWSLFYKHDLKLIQQCFDICKRNDKRSIGYLHGCIKRRSQ